MNMFAMTMAMALLATDGPANIWNGDAATTCQWPLVGQFDFYGCGATLVAPQIAITAAHCLNEWPGEGLLRLGEAWEEGAHDLELEYCRPNPDWPFSALENAGADIAYCKLAEPVYDIPFTPIVHGCETEIIAVGQPIVIVGFGLHEPGEAEFIKHFVDTTITQVGATLADPIRLGGPDGITCLGDSGGPAYVQFPDGSWHVFGVASMAEGGVDWDVCGNATSAIFALISTWVPWIEEDSGIDITPCHDADGTWNPSGWCQGFEVAPLDGGDWGEYCLGEVSGPSVTCGPPFDAEPDADPPTIAITSPVDETIFEGAPVEIEIAIDVDDGDGHGVRSVELSINGAVEELMREPPYDRPASLPQGVYELVAVAEDWAGNVAQSEAVRIAVDAELPEEETGTSSGGGDGSSTTAAETGVGSSEGGDGSSGGASGEPAEEEAGGCGCSTTSARGWWMLLLLGLVGVRRKAYAYAHAERVRAHRAEILPERRSFPTAGEILPEGHGDVRGKEEILPEGHGDVRRSGRGDPSRRSW